jgi:hypothetical protein
MPRLPSSAVPGIAALLLAASAGCGDLAVTRQYQAALGVPREAAAGSGEAGLDRPGLLPLAAGFVPAKVAEVHRADIFSVRRADDGSLMQVRLAGAEVPSDDPAGAERLGRARQMVAGLVGRDVVVEVPPSGTVPAAGNEGASGAVYAHLIIGGRCVDAALVLNGVAVPRAGRYPRYAQMVRAYEAARGSGPPVRANRRAGVGVPQAPGGAEPTIPLPQPLPPEPDPFPDPD